MLARVGRARARLIPNGEKEREEERKGRDRERERATRQCVRRGVVRTESFSLRENTGADGRRRTEGELKEKSRERGEGDGDTASGRERKERRKDSSA